MRSVDYVVNQIKGISKLKAILPGLTLDNKEMQKRGRRR